MNRVQYRGETFLVEYDGKPICELLPARPPKFTGADLVTFLRFLPKPDQGSLTAVERLIVKQPAVVWSRRQF
jgi:hypothetical protein